MAIKPLTKQPRGLADTVHPFKNDETGKIWHAELEYHLGDTTSDTHMIVVIHITEADGTVHDGSISYAINSADLANPDFSAEKAVENVIIGHIERSETIRKNKLSLEPLMMKFKPLNA